MSSSRTCTMGPVEFCPEHPGQPFDWERGQPCLECERLEMAYEQIIIGNCPHHKGVDRIPGTMHCNYCVQENPRLSKRTRGKCPRHETHPLIPDTMHCNLCLAEWEDHAQSMADFCGRHWQPLIAGTRACPRCRQASAARAREDEALYKGDTCGRHRKPVVPGTKSCARCLQDCRKWNIRLKWRKGKYGPNDILKEIETALARLTAVSVRAKAQNPRTKALADVAEEFSLEQSWDPVAKGRLNAVLHALRD